MNSYFCDSCKLKLEGNPVAVQSAYSFFISHSLLLVVFGPLNQNTGHIFAFADFQIYHKDRFAFSDRSD